MAARGRKPKPTALKELEGNPGKRSLNPSEPKPPPARHGWRKRQNENGGDSAKAWSSWAF